MLEAGIIGVQELIVIAIVIAIICLVKKGKQLPELGSSMGKGLRNFKKGLKEGAAEEEKTPVEPYTEPPKEEC